MTNIDINTLGDILADEAWFPAEKGHRDPSCPSFIYFDDDRELHPDVKAFREDLANMEEWIAFKEHGRALDERRERKVRDRKIPVVPYTEDRGRKTDDNPHLPRSTPPPPSFKDIRRGEMFARAFTRRVREAVVEIRSIEDDFEDPSTEAEIYELCEYSNLPQVLQDRYNQQHPQYDDQGVLTNPFLNIQLVKTRSTKTTYSQARETQRFCNWLINFHKQRPKDNDRWRKLVGPLASRLDETDPIAPMCRMILRTMKELLPFAPSPVKGTLFVNPDGSTWHSSSTNFGTAKASYMKRHGLTDEFVTVERVQWAKEGVDAKGRPTLEAERHSTYVVGIRKTSDSVPSNYYDPNPVMAEKIIDGEWVATYLPSACNLYRVPKSMVMPEDSHRLTIREFEQAIIAGAECFDDPAHSFARDFEEDILQDTRVSIINMGDGNNARDKSALSHEESYLYGILQMFEETRACELMLMEDQGPGTLRSHFLESGLCASKVRKVHALEAKGSPIPPSLISPTVVAILRHVAQDPEAVADNLLPYVREILTGDYSAPARADVEALTTREMTSLDSFIADQIEYELSLPKAPAYHKWG